MQQVLPHMAYGTGCPSGPGTFRVTSCNLNYDKRDSDNRCITDQICGLHQMATNYSLVKFTGRMKTTKLNVVSLECSLW